MFFLIVFLLGYHELQLLKIKFDLTLFDIRDLLHHKRYHNHSIQNMISATNKSNFVLFLIYMLIVTEKFNIEVNIKWKLCDDLLFKHTKKDFLMEKWC